uniref:THAP domain-containing protein 1 n=1 Tax=Poecilia reticulata TaxID=8081 RepID=A0A3P9Q9W1_POERE
MPKTCCVDSCLSRRSDFVYHRFPVTDPERLRQWLFTLGMDPNTPVHVVSKIFVCQKHFQPDDYLETDSCVRRRGPMLKITAVPTECVDDLFSVRFKRKVVTPSDQPAAISKHLVELLIS